MSKILIIDDELETRETIELFLKENGIRSFLFLIVIE